MNQRLIAHYRILDPLGAGGTGEVFLAEDTRLHSKVAVKVLPRAQAAEEDAKPRGKLDAIVARMNGARRASQ